MGKSRKDYEKFLNSISPDRDDETWIIVMLSRWPLLILENKGRFRYLKIVTVD